MADDEHAARQWTLEPESEYRFELDPSTSILITLVHGHAEVFGAELLEGKPYLFHSECKAAIFTWHGCTLQVTGFPSTEYVSDETPMVAYANLHLAFEHMRVRALAAQRGSPSPDTPQEHGHGHGHTDLGVSSMPPRVLVLGPDNSGKTTTCKILTNYTVRAGQSWSPVLVNLDPNEGAWTVPGAISAASIDMPLSTSSAASPLGSTATSAPSVVTSNALLPLVYWFGHSEPRRNPLLFERLIRNLGDSVGDRLEADPEARVSGVIVDTPSSFAASGTNSLASEHRTKLLNACVDAFRINTIIVVGHEKLNVEMQRLYNSRGITVIKIPKSGGVVELDLSFRERVQNSQLHLYMYGAQLQGHLPRSVSASALGEDLNNDTGLSPSSMVIGFDVLSIYRIGGESMAPNSALPIGAARVVSETQPILVKPDAPGSGLLNRVLALLSLPANQDPVERYDEELLDLDVAGFLYVTNIDMVNRKMTILSPNIGSLAGRTALVGSFEWQE